MKLEKEDILEINNSYYAIAEKLEYNNNEYFYLVGIESKTEPKFVIVKKVMIDGSINFTSLDDEEFELVKILFGSKK